MTIHAANGSSRAADLCEGRSTHMQDDSIAYTPPLRPTAMNHAALNLEHR